MDNTAVISTAMAKTVSPGLTLQLPPEKEMISHTDPCHQVFSEVTATVSPQLLKQLDVIPRDTLLERLRHLAQVLCDNDKENISNFVLRGSWQQLEAAQRLLKRFFHDTSAGGLTSGESQRDAAVTCHLLTTPQMRRETAAVAAAVVVKYRTRRQARAASTAARGLRRLSGGCNVLLPFAIGQSASSPNVVVVDKDLETVEESHIPRTPPVLAKIDSKTPTDVGGSSLTAKKERRYENENVVACKSPRPNYELLTPYKFFCKKCSFKTKRESHFARHLLIHDKVKTLYRCDSPGCTFSTIRLSHLRRHSAMSHTPATFDCDQCSYRTGAVSLLARHVKLRHRQTGTEDTTADPTTTGDIRRRPPSDSLMRCDQCPYTTTRPHYFRRHGAAHARANRSSRNSGHDDADGVEGAGGATRNVVYLCAHCPYKTSRKEHFNRHRQNVHDPERRPYLCDHCGKAFKRPDALKQHRLTHGGAEARSVQFTCGSCQKKCRSAAHLVEHEAVHSNDRSFLCEICGAAFKTRSVQRKHVVTIHKNPRAFPCDHCYKRFNTKYALRRHLRLHLGGGVEVEVDPDAEPSSTSLMALAPTQEQISQPDLEHNSARVIVVHPLHTDESDCLMAGDVPVTLSLPEDALDPVTGNLRPGSLSVCVQTADDSSPIYHLSATGFASHL